MAGKKRSSLSAASAHSATSSSSHTSPSPAAASASPPPSLRSPSAAPQSQKPVTLPPQIARFRPKKLGFLKRSWLWYESSFAISMLEPWEKILLHSFLAVLLAFVYVAGTRYLPATIERLRERIVFYIYGTDDDGVLVEL